MKRWEVALWFVQATVIALANCFGTSPLHKSFRRLVVLAPSARGLSHKEAKIDDDNIPLSFQGTVDVVDRGENHVVVSKPASVVVHHRYVLVLCQHDLIASRTSITLLTISHSDWAGSRSKKRRKPEFPMLQRTREAIGERVNLVHRLDRGASGCLLFTMASSDEGNKNATATLQHAMTLANKTYVAIVRGEGIIGDRDLKREGWFEVTRPIKDEKGMLNNATTSFRFVAGQDNGGGSIDRPRASLVLARPQSGRWHQIRRHLNGLSHPIIGDSSHGNSKVNRDWRENRGLPGERTCLHLLQLEIPPNNVCPGGIRAFSPLATDMMELLETYLPNVLKHAIPILREEGLHLTPKNPDHVTTIPVEIQY